MRIPWRTQATSFREELRRDVAARIRIELVAPERRLLA
jgi:hypothetical protein